MDLMDPVTRRSMDPVCSVTRRPLGHGALRAGSLGSSVALTEDDKSSHPDDLCLEVKKWV